MEVDELLRRAWESVQKAELPEALQEAAFKLAVDLVEDEDIRRAVRSEIGVDVATANARRIRRVLVALNLLPRLGDYRVLLLPDGVEDSTADAEYLVAATSGKKKKKKKKIGSEVDVGDIQSLQTYVGELRQRGGWPD